MIERDSGVENDFFTFMLKVLPLWNYCQSVPFCGKYVFSWIATFVAPYTGTIPFRIEKLDNTLCQAFMYHWFFVGNPFASVHAAALTNFGEMTQGFAMLAWAQGQKEEPRIIPTALNVVFLKKAKGTLRSTCIVPNIASDATETVVKTEIFNGSNELVCTVTGTWKLSIPIKKFQ